MLKTLGSTESLTRLREDVVEIRYDSRAGHDGSKLNQSGINDSEIDGGEVDDEFRKKGQKMSKSKKSSKSKKTVRFLDFLIPGAKLVFTKLRQAFFKALILYHFNPEHHIRIEQMHQAILSVEFSVS